MAQPEQCSGNIITRDRYLGMIVRPCTRRAKYEGMCATCYRAHK